MGKSSQSHHWQFELHEEYLLANNPLAKNHSLKALTSLGYELNSRYINNINLAPSASTRPLDS